MLESDPKPEVVARAERHLREDHQRPDFDLRRDMHWERNQIPDGVLTYRPEYDLRPSGFLCSLCNCGFSVTPSYGHPERNQAVRVAYVDQVRPLLAGLSMEEQERVIEDWDRGRLARETLDRIDRKQAMAVKKPRDPKTTARIEACQRFLLEHYREHGNLENALDALCQLARVDPGRHQEIVGRPQPFSVETYSSYWRRIPIADRRQAKSQAEERIAREKATRLEERKRRLGG